MAVAGSPQQSETLMWTTAFLHDGQVKVRAALKGHTEAEDSNGRYSVLTDGVEIPQ